MRVIMILMFIVLSQITVKKVPEADITIIKALELSNIEARKLKYSVEGMEVRIIGTPATWAELQKHHWFFRDFKDDNKENDSIYLLVHHLFHLFSPVNIFSTIFL